MEHSPSGCGALTTFRSFTSPSFEMTACRITVPDTCVSTGGEHTGIGFSITNCAIVPEETLTRPSPAGEPAAVSPVPSALVASGAFGVANVKFTLMVVCTSVGTLVRRYGLYFHCLTASTADRKRVG